MPLTLGSHTRLLVVAPHPDDEIIATGELIQHVLHAGGEVQVLLMTDGDNNPWPQRWTERRLWIGPTERERWGRQRRGEARQAIRRLGLEPEALVPLGLPDMGLTAWLRHSHEALVELLVGRLHAFHPSLVAIPSLADRHPDHSAAHVLVRHALARWKESAPALLTYLVHGADARQGEEVALAPRVGMHELKQAALAEHASQMALSGERMRALAGRPEQFRQIRALRRDTGVLPWQVGTIRKPGLRLTLADETGVQTWPGHAAPVRPSPGGGSLLELDAPLGTVPRFGKLHMDLRSPWIFDHWGWWEL